MHFFIMPILALLTASFSPAPGPTFEHKAEIRVRSGEFVMSAEGGIRLDLEATAITRLEDGSIRILAPATVRLTTTREFRMTFNGSPSFALELHPTKEGAKAVLITGATIRFEGDGSGASISSASSITVLN